MTVARNTHLRLRLLTDDAQLIDYGNQAVTTARAIHGARTAADKGVLGARALEALDVFVTAAGSQLRGGDTPEGAVRP
ncbi:hypothetical protein Pth03_12560 [Planotetraspora thailandica]|uniref:Uncharacterized protein n=1 Tax=Planotetraspora thailandica TaxID=487172 RepID=A0A8J3XS66_9ACTN|nr:hypothetical protein Pth03_12560 [Planotetraspora thailandica]